MLLQAQPSASPGSFIEIYNLRALPPDLQNRNLHSNKIPGDLSAEQGLRSTALDHPARTSDSQISRKLPTALPAVPGTVQGGCACSRKRTGSVDTEEDGSSPFLVFLSTWRCDSSGFSLLLHTLFPRSGRISLVSFDRKNWSAQFSFCLLSFGSQLTTGSMHSLLSSRGPPFPPGEGVLRSSIVSPSDWLLEPASL